MKFIKKVFFMFFSITFFIQSCMFNTTIAQNIPVNTTKNEIELDNMKFIYNSEVNQERCNLFKIVSNFKNQGNGISKINAENISGNKIKWTIDLSDIEFNSHLPRGIFVTFDADSQKKLFQDIHYEAHPDDKFVNKQLEVNETSILTEKSPGHPKSLENQKLMFTTSRNFDELNFSITYSYNNQKYELIKININQLVPLKFKFVGANDIDMVLLSIKDENGNYITYRDEKLNSDTNTTSAFILNPGKYTVSLSADNYTLEPSNFVIIAKNGTITLDDKTYDDSVIPIEAKFNSKDENPEIQNSKKKVNYITDKDGTYPSPFVEPDNNVMYSENIRNADTKKMNFLGSDYKIEYSDSIVAKWAEPTNKEDEFIINLTVRGKTYVETGMLDIVFVLDNSFSMNSPFDAPETAPIALEYKKSKMYSLHESVSNMVDSILIPKNNTGNTTTGNRVGIVNFATLTTPIMHPVGVKNVPYSYPPGTEDFVNRNVLLDTYRYKTTKYLTSNPQSAKSCIPYIGRNNYPGVINGTQNYNLGIAYDGLTNISAGLKKGTDILYSSNKDDNRRKIMILVTDGMPTASYKINSVPLDISKTFEENLNNNIYFFVPGSIAEYFPSAENLGYNKFKIGSGIKNTETYGLIANNYGGLFDLSYTVGSTKLNTHRDITTQISRYLKNKHKDMELYSLYIGGSNDGVKKFLYGISTGGKYGFNSVNSADELANYINTLDEVTKNSIVNGIVTDPMGEQVSLIKKSANDVFKPASNYNLSDGDYYLSGFKNSKPDKSILDNVKVSLNGDTIKILNLNLGENDEIYLRYKIKLKTYTADYKGNYWYQANKRTTLQPELNKSNVLRDFPIPSVKGKVNIVPSELPSTGGVYFGIPSVVLTVLAFLVCIYIYITNIKSKGSDL